jgi:hypothetical protein
MLLILLLENKNITFFCPQKIVPELRYICCSGVSYSHDIMNDQFIYWRNRKMKLTTRKFVLIVFIAFLVTFTIPSKGKNPFLDEITTESGFSTWDSNMVNVE